jgi:hypothetical protein
MWREQELVDRPGRPLCNCEQYIKGEFKKVSDVFFARLSLTPHLLTLAPSHVCSLLLSLRCTSLQYNNNVGAAVTASASVVASPSSASVHSKDRDASTLDARTAQCFSHFTYQHSAHQILICDIQGVGGVYTDPQIHTITGKGFGEGNLGAAGITAFLLRHTCNEICASLNLSKVQVSSAHPLSLSLHPPSDICQPLIFTLFAL